MTGPAIGPVLVVSGTGTEVGKTVVTAAVAALAASGGRRVAVVKPVQTGEPPGPTGDLAVIRRLSGVTQTHELARFGDPLSPEAAARAAGKPPLDLAAASVFIKQLGADADLVLVEGAGGLLVRYDPAGGTIADLAGMLDAPVLVVTTAGLGTLNHTALTLEALSTRRLAAAGVVIGAWPAEPGPAERANLTDLAVIAGQPAKLRFTIEEPHRDAVVKNFEITHEKLFHLFVISHDMEFFEHIHPPASMCCLLFRFADQCSFYFATFIQHPDIIKGSVSKYFKIQESFVKSCIIFYALYECGNIQVAAHYNFLKRNNFLFKID